MKKLFVIESRIKNGGIFMGCLWGKDWSKWKSYETAKRRDQALEVLRRKDSKYFDYRPKDL